LFLRLKVNWKVQAVAGVQLFAAVGLVQQALDALVGFVDVVGNCVGVGVEGVPATAAVASQLQSSFFV
jgi:orotate phosphoribosyltransferase-like protein